MAGALMRVGRGNPESHQAVRDVLSIIAKPPTPAAEGMWVNGHWFDWSKGFATLPDPPPWWAFWRK